MDETRTLLIQRNNDKRINGFDATNISQSSQDSAQFQCKEQDRHATYGATDSVIYHQFN